MRRLAFVLMLVLLCVWVKSSRADDLADEADLQFLLGTQAYRAGNFRGALEHFLASNRLVPNANSIYNVARAYERLEMYPEAHRAYTSVLDVEQGADARASVERELSKIRPKVAIIRVSSDPRGATIYLDRKDLGPRGTAPRELAVTAGEYTVIVELPGYHTTQSNKIRVAQGQTVETALNLSPLRGVVEIVGERGISVFVGSRKASADCSAPCSLSLPAGDQTLVFARVGYATREMVVFVPPAQKLKLNPALEPLLGNLVVNTDEPGARVEIDGRVVGFTPSLTSIPVGTHQVIVSMLGYKPFKATALIENNQETRLELDLTRDDRVIAASRRNEGVEDAPGSISLVSNQELRALAYPTLAEALKGRPGAYLSDDGAYVNVGVRGMSRFGSYGNRLLVLQDGMATNDNWVGSSYVGYDAMTDLGDVDRIELVRGPGSVLYGTSAFSGVVNVVTRGVTQNSVEVSVADAYPNVARARIRGDMVLGSGATLWTSVGATSSQGTDVFIPYFANVTPKGSTAGVARDVDGSQSGTVRGRLEWEWLTASYFLNSHSKHFPGAQFNTIFGDPRAVQTDTRGFIELKAEPSLSNGTTSMTRAYLNHYTFNGQYPHDPTEGGLEVDTYHGHWFGAEQRFSHQLTSKASFTWGGEFQWHFDVSESARDNTGLFLNDTNEHSKPFTVAAGYMAIDAQTAPWARISLGARLDHYSTFGNSANPRLAFIFKPWKHGNLKLIMGRAFRAPSVYELFYNDGGYTQVANPELKPEVIYSAEAEFSQHVTPTVSTTWSTWANTVHNLIDSVVVANGDYHPTRFSNMPLPVVAYGSDVTIRRDWRQGWMIEGNFGVQHAEYLQSSSFSDLVTLAVTDQGQHMANFPARSAGLRAVAPIMARQLTLGTRFTYIDSRWTRYDPSNNEMQSQTNAAVLWDLVLSGEEQRVGIGYYLGAYNLFDWRYSLPVGFEFKQQTMPQAGRAVVAGLSWHH